MSTVSENFVSFSEDLSCPYLFFMEIFLWKDKNDKLRALIVYFGILSHITGEYPELFGKTTALFVKPGLQKALPQAIQASDQRSDRHDLGTVHSVSRARQRFHQR